MCMSIPGKVVKIENNISTIDYEGEIREAANNLVPDVKIGYWVVVSARIIMQIIPEDEAKKTLKLWDKTDEL